MLSFVALNLEVVSGIGIPVYKYAKRYKESQPPKGKFIRVDSLFSRES
tara:strand:+ start:699 stop:842 length:144 start_codon:yes stop_codon:yes gene_type:complete